MVESTITLPAKRVGLCTSSEQAFHYVQVASLQLSKALRYSQWGSSLIVRNEVRDEV